MFIVRKHTNKVNISPIRSATTNELLRYEESINGEYKNIISDLKDALAKHSQQISNLERQLEQNTSQAKIAYITLFADAWEGTTSPYSQVVDVDGVTPNSQVDLMLSVEHLDAFWQKNVGFVTENIDGIITVYAIGQKPINDYTFQVTITEVDR